MPRRETYRIVRFYENEYPTEVIARGMTLEDARLHCQHPETSSMTATTPLAVERTRKMGRWFDGYEKEGS